MGGKGSGGSRVGAGRRRKSAVERALDGGAGHRPGRVLQHPRSAVDPDSGQSVATPPAALPVVDESDAPNDLTVEEREVWLKLAPLALANGTLTTDTAFQFMRMCRNIALESRYAKSVQDAGGANHRGLIQRVDTELLGFGLAGTGRKPPAAKPAVDPLEDKYFGVGRNRA